MQIVTFMANMKSYPVAAAILIMALYVVIARVTIGITQRLIRSICADGNQKYRDELFRMVHFSTWTILPLMGVIVIFQWLNPLPQYQYALLGLLKTLILLSFLISLNQFMSALFLYWRDNPDLDDAVLNQIESVGKAVVIIAGPAILLSIWQVDLAPLLASAGVLGIGVHQLSTAIYKAFKEKNITIPFPQQDVHLEYVPGIISANTGGADTAG